MFALLLACTTTPPDPVQLWEEDPGEARRLLEALPEDERALRVIQLVEQHPGDTTTLCALVEGSHRERCERFNQRAHLTEERPQRTRRREVEKTGDWQLPPNPDWAELVPDMGECPDTTCLGEEARSLAKKGQLDEAARRCHALPIESVRQDCFFQAAEELGRLREALVLCRGAGSISQQCAGHVMFGMQRLPHEEALEAIAQAELGEVEVHVVALWWSHEVRRGQQGLPPEAEPHLRNLHAMDQRELAQAEPVWVLLLPQERDLPRIPMGPGYPQLRPVAQDPQVDQRLAELFAGSMATEPELDALRAAAGDSEPLLRWAAALLLSHHAPGDPLIAQLAQDEEPLVAERAQARPRSR